MAQRRPGIRQVLEVRRPAPVLEVGEVGDEGGLAEQLLRGEVVQVVRVREGLDELGAEASAYIVGVAMASGETGCSNL